MKSTEEANKQTKNNKTKQNKKTNKQKPGFSAIRFGNHAHIMGFKTFFSPIKDE